MATKVVNPNRSYTEAQLSQLGELLDGRVEVVEISTNFPSASDGGMAEVAYAAAMSYPEGALVHPMGQSTGAAAITAALHGRNRSQFGSIVVFGGPPAFAPVGVMNLDSVRNVARATRYQDGEFTEPVGSVVLLNFSHPLTGEQKEQVGGLLGVAPEEIDWREALSRQYQFETVDELCGQVFEQMKAVGLSPQVWQESKIVVNLPALSAGALVALADMHGRMGHFPVALRIERVESGEFEFTEAVDLEALRLRALTVSLKERAQAQVLVNRNDLQALLALANNCQCQPVQADLLDRLRTVLS